MPEISQPRSAGGVPGVKLSSTVCQSAGLSATATVLMRMWLSLNPGNGWVVMRVLNCAVLKSPRRVVGKDISSIAKESCYLFC